jgi:hypothetical protein
MAWASGRRSHSTATAVRGVPSGMLDIDIRRWTWQSNAPVLEGTAAMQASGSTA